MGDRFGAVALQVGSHLTRQIHDTVQSLHIYLIWRPQRRMLIQQCPYFGRDLRVARTCAGAALSICAIYATSGKCGGQDDEAGDNVEWCVRSHLIRVPARLPRTDYSRWLGSRSVPAARAFRNQRTTWSRPGDGQSHLSTERFESPETVSKWATQISQSKPTNGPNNHALREARLCTS